MPQVKLQWLFIQQAQEDSEEEGTCAQVRTGAHRRHAAVSKRTQARDACAHAHRTHMHAPPCYGGSLLPAGSSLAPKAEAARGASPEGAGGEPSGGGWGRQRQQRRHASRTQCCVHAGGAHCGAAVQLQCACGVCVAMSGTHTLCHSLTGETPLPQTKYRGVSKRGNGKAYARIQAPGSGQRQEIALQVGVHTCSHAHEAAHMCTARLGAERSSVRLTQLRTLRGRMTQWRARSSASLRAATSRCRASLAARQWARCKGRLSG